MLQKVPLIIITALSAMLALSSCVSQKELNRKLYFSDTLNPALVAKVKEYEPVIEVGDRLSVYVAALNQEAAKPYNYQASAVGLEQGGYDVRKDGMIELPQIGKVLAAGKTRPQLIIELTETYLKYLYNPLVNVQFLNFKITVLGEVGRPGQLNIPDGKLNILQAVAMVGDIGINSRKDNVLVVREKEGVRTFGRVNLNNHDVFNSPYFNLKQNDLVYVELEKQTIANNRSTTTRQNIGIITSVIGILTTLILLFTRL